MSFDPLQIVQLVIQYGPTVKALWDSASSNEEITAKIKAISQPLASLLENLGSTFFPKAAPALHIVGGIVAGFDPNVTKWLQGSLNNLVSPSPMLAVDGFYGSMTRAAVIKFQESLGLKADGIAGMITQAAIAKAIGGVR